MGRAGPAQLTGPDSAQQGLGRSQPNKVSYFVWVGPGLDTRDGPESVWPTNTWLGQNQSGPEKKKTNNARPESAWPSNITSGGNYFPPPLLHAECCSFCMQGKTTKAQIIRGEKSYLARRRWCVAGLAALLAVLRWRPVDIFNFFLFSFYFF